MPALPGDLRNKLERTVIEARDVAEAGALAAAPTRIDLFNAKGNRTGSAVVEGDRVDLFDTRRNRTGSARIEDGRRVDFFDTRGNRSGYAVVEGDRMDFFDARSDRTGSGRIGHGEVETFNRSRSRTSLGQWSAARGPWAGSLASGQRGKGQGDGQCHESRNVP